MQQILVVQAGSEIHQPITELLSAMGFSVLHCSQIQKALQHLKTVKLVVLGPVLTSTDALGFAQRVREHHLTLPILWLSSTLHRNLRIAALQSGMDEVIPLPFDDQEMVLRVRALLRHHQNSDVLSRGPFQLNLSERTVFHQGKQVETTPLEFKLLLALASHPGQVHSRDHLMETVWQGHCSDVRNVDIKIADLRKKLQDAGWIQTVWGQGYRFKPETA